MIEQLAADAQLHEYVRFLERWSRKATQAEPVKMAILSNLQLVGALMLPPATAHGVASEVDLALQLLCGDDDASKKDGGEGRLAVDVLGQADDLGRMPLFAAATNRRLRGSDAFSRVLQWLEALGVDAGVSCRDAGGMTMLHHAARIGDATVAALLIERKADVNAAREGNGVIADARCVPITLALEHGWREVMTMLAAAGCEPPKIGRRSDESKSLFDEEHWQLLKAVNTGDAAIPAHSLNLARGPIVYDSRCRDALSGLLRSGLPLTHVTIDGAGGKLLAEAVAHARSVPGALGTLGALRLRSASEEALVDFDAAALVPRLETDGASAALSWLTDDTTASLGSVAFRLFVSLGSAPHIRSLTISNSRLFDDGCVALSLLLKAAHHLNELDLSSTLRSDPLEAKEDDDTDHDSDSKPHLMARSSALVSVFCDGCTPRLKLLNLYANRTIADMARLLSAPSLSNLMELNLCATLRHVRQPLSLEQKGRLVAASFGFDGDLSTKEIFSRACRESATYGAGGALGTFYTESFGDWWYLKRSKDDESDYNESNYDHDNEGGTAAKHEDKAENEDREAADGAIQGIAVCEADDVLISCAGLPSLTVLDLSHNDLSASALPALLLGRAPLRALKLNYARLSRLELGSEEPEHLHKRRPALTLSHLGAAVELIVDPTSLSATYVAAAIDRPRPLVWKWHGEVRFIDPFSHRKPLKMTWRSAEPPRGLVAKGTILGLRWRRVWRIARESSQTEIESVGLRAALLAGRFSFTVDEVRSFGMMRDREPIHHLHGSVLGMRSYVRAIAADGTACFFVPVAPRITSVEESIGGYVQLDDGTEFTNGAMCESPKLVTSKSPSQCWDRLRLSLRDECAGSVVELVRLAISSPVLESLELSGNALTDAELRQVAQLCATAAHHSKGGGESSVKSSMLDVLLDSTVLEEASVATAREAASRFASALTASARPIRLFTQHDRNTFLDSDHKASSSQRVARAARSDKGELLSGAPMLFELLAARMSTQPQVATPLIEGEAVRSEAMQAIASQPPAAPLVAVSGVSTTATAISAASPSLEPKLALSESSLELLATTPITQPRSKKKLSFWQRCCSRKVEDEEDEEQLAARPSGLAALPASTDEPELAYSSQIDAHFMLAPFLGTSATLNATTQLLTIDVHLQGTRVLNAKRFCALRKISTQAEKAKLLEAWDQGLESVPSGAFSLRRLRQLKALNTACKSGNAVKDENARIRLRRPLSAFDAGSLGHFLAVSRKPCALILAENEPPCRSASALFEGLATSSCLRSVDLRFWSIAARDLEQLLRGVTQLSYLDVRGCNVHGQAALGTALARSRSLTCLDARHTGLSITFHKAAGSLAIGHCEATEADQRIEARCVASAELLAGVMHAPSLTLFSGGSVELIRHSAQGNLSCMNSCPSHEPPHEGCSCI